ncbi:MAG: hypothetical protein ACI9ZF_001206 [Bradyrhizobium sp.]|jgi:hypothetical protein
MAVVSLCDSVHIHAVLPAALKGMAKHFFGVAGDIDD